MRLRARELCLALPVYDMEPGDTLTVTVRWPTVSNAGGTVARRTRVVANF